MDVLTWLLEVKSYRLDLASPLDVVEPPYRRDTEEFIDELAPSLNKAITITVVGATSGAREGPYQLRKAERPLVRIDLNGAKIFGTTLELIRCA